MLANGASDAPTAQRPSAIVCTPMGPSPKTHGSKERPRAPLSTQGPLDEDPLVTRPSSKMRGISNLLCLPA